MAIRQRLKRKVKTVLKSFIDRLVDADSEPFQESQPSSSVDYDVKKQSSDASNIDKSQVEVATVENPVVEEEARVEAVDAPASESESIAEAPKAEVQTDVAADVVEPEQPAKSIETLTFLFSLIFKCTVSL